jgi:hypothetical protein
MLILIGGLVTAAWDNWLLQEVGKARVYLRARRRRARDGGDCEEVNASGSMQPTEQSRDAPTELTQRKSQVEGLKHRAPAGQVSAGPEPAKTNSVREGEASTEPNPVADTKTHNISVKMGISLIVGFLGKSSTWLFWLAITLHSIFHNRHDSSWCTLRQISAL